MHIKTLELTNYRNHKNLALDFSKDITLITGENGSGKTNIIEAINLLSTGKGFKSSFDKETICYEEKSATIKGVVIKEAENSEETEVRIGVMIEKTEDITNKSIKTVKINGKPARIGALSDNFNTVLFSPLEMNLLVNGPSQRRDFLDTLLSQGDSEYKKNLSDYTKVRRQRNKVLETIRETQAGYAQLKFWNERLVNYGKDLQKKRNEFFEYLNANINETVQKVDVKIKTQVKYLINPALEEKLENIQEREIAAGTTLIGPHRDDFMFTSVEYGENQDLAKYASRGQQRTLILGLKLCELNYLRERIKDKPVLLLDDIFSELDENHRKAVEELVYSQQTIITSTDKPLEYKDLPRI
ncbi:MAG TPA: DNA replication/repair protein RecF, partial [Bacteroidetes bacterium]|nr:DNA replication/repair protein RecF [Bacteroidota bacterium]